MKIIEKLTEQMEEELNDAEMYIDCAMRWKEEDPLLAKTYSDLSADEVKHALNLHENSVRIINAYKQTGATVPPEMQAVYDYMHQKHMDRLNRIKLEQAVYKGQ